MNARRTYETLKQQHLAEARRQQEEESLIRLLHAEQAAQRERQAADAHLQQQNRLRAEMSAANQQMLRMKARQYICISIAVIKDCCAATSKRLLCPTLCIVCMANGALAS